MSCKYKYKGKEYSISEIRDKIDEILSDNSLTARDVVSYGNDKRGQETKFQIIGEKGAKNLDQIEEATFRMDNLKVAREMEDAGKTPKEIRLLTGWEKNLADGKWRYEVLDGNLREVNLNYTNDNDMFENPTANIKLSQLYSNQELFKAYPQLKNTEVIFYNTKNELYNNNFLFVLNDKIYINKEYYEGFKLENRPTNLYDAPAPYESIAHEIQHMLQNIEGFAVGSSKKFNEDKIRESITFFRNNPEGSGLRSGYDAKYDKYLRRILENKLPKEIVDNIYSPSGLNIEVVVKNISQKAYENFAGEVEARNVQKRFFMSPQERLEQTLQETQEIPFEDQFVLQFENNVQASIKTAPQITPEIIERLRKIDPNIDFFLLSTQEINKRLEELGVSEEVLYQKIPEKLKTPFKVSIALALIWNLNSRYINENIQYKNDGATKEILKSLSSDHFIYTDKNGNLKNKTKEGITINNETDSFLQDLWKKAGYPKISISAEKGITGGRSFYNPVTNEVIIKVDMKQLDYVATEFNEEGNITGYGVSPNLILAELSHALQSSRGELSVGRFVTDFITSDFSLKETYKKEGTIENDAHGKLEKELVEEFNKTIQFQKALNNVGINLITNGFTVKEYPTNSKILDILIAKNVIEKVC